MRMTSEHIHELLDRTHVASKHVQMALGEHPALAAQPDWKALYDEAVDKLESLYQAIGKYLSDDE